MEYIKRVFRNYWLLSVFSAVLGIALIVDPQFFTNAIGYVIGGLLLAYGAVKLIKYFTKEGYATGLVMGIILCASGVFILVRPDFIPKVIAIVCGLYMLISGICNLQDALNLRKQGVDSWTVSGIPAILTTLLGLVLIFNPLAPVKIAMTVLGIALLVSGVSNIVGCFSAGKKLKRITKLSRDAKDDERPDIIDI